MCLAQPAPEITPAPTTPEGAVVLASPREVRVDAIVAAIDVSALDTRTIMRLGLQHGPRTATVVEQRWVQGFLKEAPQKKVARILAHPVVVTASGRVGTDAHGTNVPYLAQDDKGETQIKYLFAGTSVSVRPTILTGAEGESVHLEIYTAFSSPPGTKMDAPALDLRSTRSAIVLRDGQTACLYGGTFRAITRTRTKMPILGDLPAIGGIFHSIAERESEEEYVTFATVQLLTGAAVPTPSPSPPCDTRAVNCPSPARP